ncbi:hypothetical protein N7534_003202 [Penicillium rubens]|nr:hypothetical protein N7534_003202 [Penicillium rubens]
MSFGLIGLIIVVTLLFWAIRFLAHEAKLSDPQRALTDHFVKQGQEKNGEEEEPVVTIGCGYLDTPQKHLWEV